MMHWIWTILIGFVAGLIAKAITPGTGPSGFWLTVIGRDCRDIHRAGFGLLSRGPSRGLHHIDSRCSDTARDLPPDCEKSAVTRHVRRISWD